MSLTRVGHLLQLMNLLWYTIILQSSYFTLEFTVDIVYSRAWKNEQRHVSLQYHTDYFNSPTSLSALPTWLFSFQHLAITDFFFYSLHSFAFSRMLYSWNRSIYSLSHWLKAIGFQILPCLFLVLNNILLSWWTTVHLSIHILKSRASQVVLW